MKMDRRTNNRSDRFESKSNEKRPKRKKPSDMQFAGIIEKMNEGFMALDAQMNYIYINQRGGELLKRKSEDLIGKNYWDEYPEDKNTSFGQAYLRALETQIPIEFEDYYAPGDRWFQNRIFPFENGLSIFFNDITGRKQAEKAMRENEERFQTLANGSPVLLWVNGLEGCEFVNREYLDFLGIATETNVRGYDWSGFVHPDDQEAYIAAYLRAFEKQTVFSAEFRFRRYDGQYRWMRSEATPRRAADGSFTGYVGASVDITVRKRTEQALAESARQQEALYQLTDRLQHTKSLEDIFNAALDAILSALQCDRASILLFDKADVMRFVAWRGLSDDYRKATDGHSPWKPDEKNPEPISMNDVSNAELSDSLRAVIKKEGIGSLAFIPLVFNGKLIGKFMTYFDVPHTFGEREIELSLTIARQLAVGIERKQEEDALRRSEERLRLATQAARMFTWEVDIRTQASTVSDNFADALGFSPDLIPKDNEEILERFIHPEDTQIILESLTKAVQSHSDVFSLQYRILNPENGQPIWLGVNGKVIYDSNGSPERIFGVAQNITENKQTEEYIRYLNSELQAQLDEMNTLLNILPTGVWIGNHDCSEITGNPAAYQMLGFEPGINVSVTNPEPQVSTGLRLFVNGAEVSPENSPMQVVARSGKPWHGFEHELLFAGGTHKSIYGSVVPVLDEQGAVRKVIASYTDFTERKQAENRLAVLTEISELTRKIEDPNELTYAIAKVVGEHLRVRRCLFNETDLEKDIEIVHRDYHNGVESVAGVHKVSDYSSMTSAEMAAGKTVINNDSKTDQRTAQDYERTYALSGERAYVAVPLMRENRWVGTLWVSDDKPRQWSQEEVSLLETIAERTWNVIEKLRINRALRDSENTLQVIINTVPALISYVDTEHHYRFVNQTYNEWFGHAPNEIEGQHVRDVLGDAAYETLRPSIEKVLSGEAISFDRLIPYKDGGSRFVLVQYVPDKDTNGKVKGYFSLVQDITERKRAEEALRESEARYRFIVENTSDGIWQIELTEPMPTSLPEDEQLDWYYEHAVIRQCNLGLARMYGYDSVEEVLGLHMREVMPRENPVNLELSRQFIRSDYRLVDAESREMTRDGRELVFLNNMIGVIQDGKLTGEWGTNRDITERKRLEDERTQALHREQLLRASAEQAKVEAEQAKAEAEQELAERRLAEAALGEWADEPLPQDKRPAWLRYGIALVVTLIAVLVRAMFNPLLGDALALVTIYGAVAFSVWYGGVGPAILSVLLGYVTIMGLIVEPTRVFVLNTQNITGFALFLFSNTVVMALGERMRRAQRHAHQSARVAVERQRQVESQLQEKQLAEESLRQSEALYRGIARGIPGGGVYVVDKDFRYLVVEGPVTEAFGLSREMLEGRTVMEVFPDERGKRMEDRLRRNFAGEHVEFETPFNGRFYWTQMAPLHDSIGQTIILTIDVTDRKQAEEALRRSEERFARFMQYLPGLAWIKDSDGRYIYANEAAEKAFNTPREKLYGSTDEDIFPPEVAAQFRMNDQLALRDGKGVQVVETLEQDDGILHYSLVSKFLIPGPDGNMSLIGGTAFDITERKQVEEALRESEERFHAILRQATAGIVRKDAEGRLTFVNQAFCNMLGYTESELLGKTIWELTHAEDLEENKRLYDRTMMKGIPFKLEKRLIRRDGSTLWVDVSVSPIMDATGKPQSAVAVEVDITKRKQAEQALSESERRFREMIDALPTAIYTTDAEGRLTHFNPAAAEFSGRVPELGTDRWCVTWKLYYPDGTPMPHDEYPMAIALKEGRAVRGVEAIAERPDGSRVWFEPYPTPLRDNEGSIVGGINMLVDITERKQAEDALQQMNLQLESRVQKRTTELQTVNQSLRDEIAERLKVEDALHESRKRLQILSQRLVDVQEEERRAIARELHDRVGQSLSALNINLVILDNQISDHVDQPIRSRLDDSMQLVSETITLVRDVMSDLRPPVLDDYGLEAALQSQLNAFKTRYEIDVQFEKPDQPIPRLSASIEMTFLRIAQEAMMNVARHAKAKQVTMSLVQEGKVVRLVVEDDGEGIQSWQDANRPGSHGLTIMRERAEAFGGDLKVSSLPGEGTKIEASIPIGVGGQDNIQKERYE